MAARSPSRIGTRKSPRVSPRSNGGTRLRRVAITNQMLPVRRSPRRRRERQQPAHDDRSHERDCEGPEEAGGLIQVQELDRQVAADDAAEDADQDVRAGSRARYGHRRPCPESPPARNPITIQPTRSITGIGLLLSIDRELVAEAQREAGPRRARSGPGPACAPRTWSAGPATWKVTDVALPEQHRGSRRDIRRAQPGGVALRGSRERPRGRSAAPSTTKRRTPTSRPSASGLRACSRNPDSSLRRLPPT